MPVNAYACMVCRSRREIAICKHHISDQIAAVITNNVIVFLAIV